MKKIKCKANDLGNEFCYLVSLTLGKSYKLMNDPKTDFDGWVEVVDNTGEVYFYPPECFDLGSIK